MTATRWNLGRFRRPGVSLVAALTFLASGLPAPVRAAAAYESARSFTASELLQPAQIKGPHHEVASAVPLDGYYYEFTIKTDWGQVEAEGMSLLRVRLDEVRALAALDDVSKSEVFLKSAGGAVLNVGKGVGAVITDPAGTAKGLGKGVKRFGTNLGRKAERGAEKAKDEVKGDGSGEGKESAASAAGGVANSVLGVSGAARKWANKVGADPYTTNRVLKKALSDIGRIDSAGSIATKVVVPIPPVVSATAGVGGLVWAKDPEALLKENEAQFKALGVSEPVMKKLYAAKGFTLTLHTRLAQALSAVKAEGSADYVETAAEAKTEREALFFTESAEMLQRFHATSPVAKLLPDSRALIALTKAGGAVALVPVDYVQWTETFAKAAGQAGERAKKELAAKSLELRLTGRVSPVARQQLAALGWTVSENAK